MQDRTTAKRPFSYCTETERTSPTSHQKHHNLHSIATCSAIQTYSQFRGFLIISQTGPLSDIFCTSTLSVQVIVSSHGIISTSKVLKGHLLGNYSDDLGLDRKIDITYDGPSGYLRGKWVVIFSLQQYPVTLAGIRVYGSKYCKNESNYG